MSLEPDALGRRVVRIWDWGAMDGLICDSSGRVLGTSVETDSIVVLTVPPEPAASGTTIGIATLVHDARIRWPDSLAWGPRGDLYLTTSRINEGANPASPFKIYRIAAGFPGTN